MSRFSQQCSMVMMTTADGRVKSKARFKLEAFLGCSFKIDDHGHEVSTYSDDPLHHGRKSSTREKTGFASVGPVAQRIKAVSCQSSGKWRSPSASWAEMARLARIVK